MEGGCLIIGGIGCRAGLFFTVNLLERRLDTLVRHIDRLREAVRMVRQRRPFHIDAWVVLPDHMRLRLPYALAELNDG